VRDAHEVCVTRRKPAINVQPSGALAHFLDCVRVTRNNLYAASGKMRIV